MRNDGVGGRWKRNQRTQATKKRIEIPFHNVLKKKMSTPLSQSI